MDIFVSYLGLLSCQLPLEQVELHLNPSEQVVTFLRILEWCCHPRVSEAGCLLLLLSVWFPSATFSKQLIDTRNWQVGSYVPTYQ